MTPYPFGSPMPDQLQSITDNLALLRAFAAQYPDIHPWALSPLGPSIYLPSTSLKAVGDILGKEGWTTETDLIWKTVMGIRVECRLPIVSRPFAWEGGK